MVVCKCGGTDVEYDHTRGDSACMSCGAVLSENQIVTELGFVENAAGQSSMVGQFVPSSGLTQLGAGARPSRPGAMFGTESREVTISRGKFKIQSMAMSLNMNRHHVEAAHRLFVLAVQNNFIQGRKTDHVVATCLYIVCRREKTQHMLIDFSDILQENVYILGKTYLKFVRVLNLALPIVDPSLFVHRFAARMEFDEKTHAVAMTALRLIARMRRDWMAIGRRPAGICGAALMIAARIHGFRRSQKEVGRIVKMCEATLRKRVLEFMETPSSQQTVAEFHESRDDFAAEMDPPAFRHNSTSNKAEFVSKKAGQEEDDVQSSETDLRKEIDDEMREALISNELRSLESEFQFASSEQNSNPEPPSERPMSPPLPSITGGDPANSEQNHEEADPASARDQKDGDQESCADERNTEIDESGRSITEESLSSESDDEELARMVLSVDEQICKEKIWTEVNKEYLQEQEIKRKWEEDQIALGIEPESVKRKRRKTKSQNIAKTPAEATMNALSNKKSAKINYDILKDLFDSAPGRQQPASIDNLNRSPAVSQFEMVDEDEGDVIHDDKISGENEAFNMQDDLVHEDYGDEEDFVDEDFYQDEF